MKKNSYANESAFSKAVVRYFKKLMNAGVPLYYIKIVGGPRQRSGTPDYLVCYKGKMVALELKMPGNKPTQLQSIELNKWRDAWATSVVAYTMDEITELFPMPED